MEMKIEQVPYDKKIVLRHLFELYQYDFSEFTNDDVNEFGVYDYEFLDNYWTESTRVPYFIKIDGKYAGFALVRKISNSEEEFYSMAEFFILKKYRKKGVGKKASIKIFEQHQGNWEVAVFKENIPAIKFWKMVISYHTKDNFNEIAKEDWNGPIFSFLVS